MFLQWLSSNLRMLLKNELSSTESPNFLALEQVTLTIDM